MSNQVSTRLVSIPDTRTIQTLWHVHLLSCLFPNQFLVTESYKIDFVVIEESSGRKQKARKKRKVQEMTEGILKVI